MLSAGMDKELRGAGGRWIEPVGKQTGSYIGNLTVLGEDNSHKATDITIGYIIGMVRV